MAFSSLYIIGNGFDRYHNIPSSYWDFRNYVQQRNPKLFEALETYFNPEDLWSDFEATLAHLDIDSIRDEASNYLVSYGAEDWSDANHHDYQYEIGERVEMVTSKLKEFFTEWVLSLSAEHDASIYFDQDAFFLNFNYTSTLQRTYGVANHIIFFVHNRAENMSSNLILGHGRKPKDSAALDAEHNWDETDDVRVMEGEDILDNYFVRTYKSTGQIIRQNAVFFTTLNGIKDIYVFGHSLSDVDLPYFEEILLHINVATVNWHVSYYGDKEREHHRSVLEALGIPASRIYLEPLDFFKTNPNQTILF